MDLSRLKYVVAMNHQPVAAFTAYEPAQELATKIIKNLGLQTDEVVEVHHFKRGFTISPNEKESPIA